MGVDRGLVKQALQGASVDTQLVGEPLVGFSLTMQLVTNKVSYVYLHVGSLLCAVLPNPYMHSNDRKKEGEQSRLHTAVVEKPLGIDKMLAFHEHLLLSFPKYDLF